MTSQYSEKNQTAFMELDILVDELAEKCSYAPAGFGKPGIRQHILDTLMILIKYLLNVFCVYKHNNY